MFKVDDSAAMGIAEGVGRTLLATEVDPITIPADLTDGATVD
jgi:hypothetical protein